MSYVAIAAALALEDVSTGERLAAFSLASFANQDHRAWPGTPIAATRAGLSRSQFLAARDSLQQRGLLAVEEAGGGRGHTAVVALVFAQTGPWLEVEINAELFEAVLGYSRARGAPRLLLATLAGLAGETGEVAKLTTDEIRTAAGIADATYRRARTALVASNEVVLDTAGGGRARTNRWTVPDPRAADAQALIASRRPVVRSRTPHPLVASVREPPPARPAKRPSTGVGAAVKGPGLSGVTARNPAQNRTVSRQTPPETPPETPSQTPPPNARTGREPKNPGTCPPSPPDGGSHGSSITIVEHYSTDRGRKRQRNIVVDLEEIRSRFRRPEAADVMVWQRIRADLARIVGESTFEICLDPLRLRAIDNTGSLLLSSPPTTRGWIAKRFGPLLDQAASAVESELRFLDDRELQVLDAISLSPPDAEIATAVLTDHLTEEKEAV